MKKQLLIALVLVALPTLAFAQGHGGSCGCGKPTGNKIHYQVEMRGDTAYHNATVAELQRWNNYVDVFTYTTGNGTVGLGNGENDLVFIYPNEAAQFYDYEMDENLYGVARLNPMSAFGSPGFNQCPMPAGTSCGTFTETDVLINGGFGAGWTPNLPAGYESGVPAVLGATIVHEVGHTLGFHHNFNNFSTMDYFEDFAAQYITVADAAFARQYYPSQRKNLTDVAVYPLHFNAAAANP
ncbi:MAG TPA: hypothetical protein VGE86_08260, partial [Thermoanaerobaculia bacterium]